MNVTKERLKKDLDDLKRSNKEDWDYIKGELLKTGRAIQRSKIYEFTSFAIKYTLLTIIGILIAGLWAGSLMALLLSNEFLLLTIILILLYVLIAVYVKLFASQEVKDECKRIDQFIMGLRPVRKSKHN